VSALVFFPHRLEYILEECLKVSSAYIKTMVDFILSNDSIVTITQEFHGKQPLALKDWELGLLSEFL